MDSNLEYTASDYIAAFRRRLGVLLVVALPIIAVAFMLSLFLPDEYTSFAKMDINLEGSNIRTLEPIDVTAYADRYIAELEDRVLKRENLLVMANDAAIFPSSEDTLTESERIDIIRDSVEVSVVTQQVISPNSGREADLITGVQVASVGADPEFVFRVAQHLARLFLDADRLSRTERATSTSTFLKEQMSITENDILDLEKQIADFKVTHACCLPELVGLNTSVIQRAERDLEDIQPRIRTLSQERAFVQAQLEEIGQHSGVTDRLAGLEQQYMTLVANYGPDHPDVVKIRREINAIASATPGRNDTFEIIELRIKLGEAEQKYSSEHPDVIRYKRELAALESKRRPGGGVAQAELLENPRYIQLRAELNSIDTQLNELRRRQPALRQKIAEYEDRLTRTPQVEGEFQAIARRLQSAQENFDDLQGRAVIARQSEALESTDIAARLVQIVAPSVPQSPSGPPRAVIFVLGMFLAGTVGVGSMLFTEMTDSTVRGSKDVIVTMDMVPLATIPVIENSLTIKTRQRRANLIRGTTIFLIAAIVLFYFT